MSIDQFVRAVGVATLILFAAGSSGAAIAEERPDAVFPGAPGAMSSGGPAEALRSAARRKGLTRVIVGLRTPMRFESAMSGPEIATQRRRLRETQDRVATRALGPAGATAAVRFDHIPYVSLWATPEQLDRLLADPDVASVERDIPVPPTLKDSTKIIHATDLFAKFIDALGRTVAVLDTGVSLKHPMLEGKVVSQACYSTNEPAETATSICPGGDPEDTGENSGRACTNVPNGCEHGTHVASIAVGDGSRFDGVARGASLIPIQVFTRFETCDGAPSPCVLSFTTDQIKGLERVYKLRNRFTIDVVNMSVGAGKHAGTCDGKSPALKTSIDNLRSAGIATVISSGNDGQFAKIGFPACISSAIAVGSTTKSDVIAFTSNHSSLVKLLAPGEAIEAAVPPKKFAVLSGTSMAAPHVSGAFAIMRDAQPEASVDDILAALQCSGKTLHQRDQGGGAVIANHPQTPRIDVLGARDWLVGRPNTKREWLFNTVDDAGDWWPLLQEWRVRQGAYVLDVVDPGAAAVEVANCSSSFTVEATMRRVDPQLDRFANSGLFFKAKINRETNAVSGYFAAYNKCPTNDAGACTNDPEDKPGQLAVFKMTDFKFDGTGGSGAPICVRKAKVNVNKDNLLKVVTNGSNHTVFLNDTQICSFADATYASGSILVTSFRNVPGSEFRVHDVKIRSSDPGPVESLAPMREPGSYAPDLVAGGLSPLGSEPVSSVASR